MDRYGTCEKCEAVCCTLFRVSVETENLFQWWCKSCIHKAFYALIKG